MSKNKSGASQPMRLQKNLGAIRRVAGWTAEDLGDKIGVTKQTISNLENEKTTMSLTQYIAIRAILDYEIQNNKENTVLPQIVTVLLDSEDTYPPETQEEFSEAAKRVATAATSGITAAQLALIAGGLFLGGAGVIPAFAVGGAATGALWLKKIAQKKSNIEQDGKDG